jgi:hypothetical protein
VNLREWQQKRWNSDIEPIVALLDLHGDAALVREALEQDVQREASQQSWRSPEMHRLLLDLVRFLELDGQKWRIWSLCQCLDRFSSAQAAREALAPVVRELRSAKPEVRQEVLFDLIETVGRSRHAVRTAWPRVSPHVVLLRRYAEATGDIDNCFSGTEAAVAIERVLRHTKTGHQAPTAPSNSEDDAADVPLADEEYEEYQEQVGAWIRWMLSHILEAESQPKNPLKYFSLDSMAFLASTLANRSLDTFKILFHAGARHNFDGNSAHLEKGVAALSSYPDLRLALAQIFPRQPGRAASLLVRLGLAARLAPEVLWPLKRLEPQSLEPQEGEHQSEVLEGGWHDLLLACPELHAEATRYRYAQRMMKKSEELPPGVRRALHEPEKIANELEHLERKLAAMEPDHAARPRISIRVASLRTRLSEDARLSHAARHQASERLTLAAAEAMVALAEQQVQACYRARLEQVAGALPEGVEFDDDWLNAALLSMDIDSNRRLLRRMLRARVENNTHWREQLPANAEFLRLLAESGADAQVWLSSRPRTYHFNGGGSSGSRVRLHLERDPLRILQMGNLFDTCLSFGGCNSFSTVANAAELNKRVIYATDNTGRVLGRKLIGLNAQHEIVGFRTLHLELPGQERRTENFAPSLLPRLPRATESSPARSRPHARRRGIDPAPPSRAHCTSAWGLCLGGRGRSLATTSVWIAAPVSVR